MTTINRIFAPIVIVLLSEMLVDWLKHAFITKFNHIRPQVYGRFVDVLCNDLAAERQSESRPSLDQSPLISRRLGFASLPLGCLAVRMGFQMVDMLSDDSHVDECAPARRAGRGWLATGNLLGPDQQAAVAKWLLVGAVVAMAWSS